MYSLLDLKSYRFLRAMWRGAQSHPCIAVHHLSGYQCKLLYITKAILALIVSLALLFPTKGISEENDLFWGQDEAKIQEPLDLGMVTGLPTGTYFRFGQDISSLMQAKNVQVSVKESAGSIDNINRIGSHENAALGIVQSDVLGFLMRSKEAKSHEAAEKLRMVFPLYNEEIHVLARKNIKSFADLSGKTIVVGPTGSGSWLTSVNLFGLSGVRPAKMLRLLPEEGLVSVLTGKADAMIYVAGKPVKLFSNLADLKNMENYAALLKNVHFVPLEDPKMIEEYSASKITSDDYSFVKKSVPTLAVSALLVAYDFYSTPGDYAKLRCDELGRFGNVMKDNIMALRQSGHPKWQEVDFDAEIGFWRRDRCTLGATSSAILERELLNTLEIKW